MPLSKYACICLQASNCLLQTTAAKSSSYSLCEDLPAGSGLKVYWSLDTAASPVLLSGALEGTTDGWLGFGFPAVPGEMIGGSAIIAKPCSACPTGEKEFAGCGGRGRRVGMGQ